LSKKKVKSKKTLGERENIVNQIVRKEWLNGVLNLQRADHKNLSENKEVTYLPTMEN